MNKGLAVHLLVTLIYGILAVFVIGEEPLTLRVRLCIVVCGLIANFFAVPFCFEHDLYDKKTK